jgi:hypothetical protein
MDVDFAGDEDGIAVPLESEATNQNDNNYATEEDDEEDGKEDEVEEKNVEASVLLQKLQKLERSTSRV